MKVFVCLFALLALASAGFLGGAGGGHAGAEGGYGGGYGHEGGAVGGHGGDDLAQLLPALVAFKLSQDVGHGGQHHGGAQYGGGAAHEKVFRVVSQ